MFQLYRSIMDPETKSWLRLFEQFSASDKWVSAGFGGLAWVAGCWLRRKEGVARLELQPVSGGGKFMLLPSAAVG